MGKVATLVDASGNPIRAAQPRNEVLAQMASILSERTKRINTGKLSYDAARDTEEFRRHWMNADTLDADSANSITVRHKLMARSRYEQGSNGYYDGILTTHTNMVIGTGPKLRMLTKNKPFNQQIEREFYDWQTRVSFRRKLWCMAHARYGDGEGFMVLRTNPAFLSDVSLDLMPIEAEQVQSPFLPWTERGHIDGIRFDDYGNILWYDVLRFHPGASQMTLNTDAQQIPPENMLHWFKLKRPGGHRGIPALTSTLNLGATSRRYREAILGKAECQADFTVLLKSNFPPDETERDPTEAMDAFELEKRMAVTLPNTLEAQQLNMDTPSAEYGEFNRQHVSEQARPISQPYNAASCDSSTYSFASGKLDTLCYRAEINIEREDCSDLVLNPMFKEWFHERQLVVSDTAIPPEDSGPLHQWDWPAHPVIDADAESRATDTELKNGTQTLREAYSAKGRDYEDELQVMAEDWFGDASQENIDMARKINMLRNLPKELAVLVAPTLGFEQPAPEPQGAMP